MAIIQKAGAIIISKENPELIALLYRSREDDWSFPKGHVEKGESFIKTAQREIKEETGLFVRFIGDELPPIQYSHSNGHQIMIRMFLAQSEDDTTLKRESKNDEIIWIPYTKVTDTLSYDNIKKYYLEALPHIETEIMSLQSETE